MKIKQYINLPELPEIESNLDSWLYNSQRLYEISIKEFIKFREIEIEKEVAYNKKYATIISEQTGKGERVTIVKEIAKAECQKEYEYWQMARAKRKHYEAYQTAYESRIQMIKYLMRRNMSERLQ